MIVFSDATMAICVLFGCLFGLLIVKALRKNVMIDLTPYGINIGDHIKSKQFFQWSASKQIIVFKAYLPRGYSQNIILQFEKTPIEMLMVDAIIPLLSKKDNQQYIGFIQYLSKYVIESEFTLLSAKNCLNDNSRMFDKY